MRQRISAIQLIVISLELLLALPFGLALSKLSIGGVAWILGGMASGGLVLRACRVLYNYSARPNRTARTIGEALVGLMIGSSIVHGNLTGVASELPVFAFLTFFILLSGTFIGYIYSRISQTNLLTAMLATVPGSVGIMSSIAADYGRNVSLVALVQVIRVTMVVLLIPVVARVSVGNGGNTITFPLNNNFFQLNISYFLLLFLVLITTSLGVRLASIFRIPAAPFFGSLIVGISFNPLLDLFFFIPNFDFSPPPLLSLIGQLLLGITIGEYWVSQPPLGKRTIGYALISVAMTLGSGFIAAVLAMFLTNWDWLTCMLVTAPGGAPEIILVSLALHHNVEIVTAGHLVRLLAINGSLPIWVFLFRHLERRLSDLGND